MVESQKRKIFVKGILYGALGAFFISTVLLVIGIKTNAFGTRAEQIQQDEEGEWLDEDVIAKLNMLENQIELSYYDEVDKEDLIDGLYKGLFEGLDDPYSVYYTPQEYEDLLISTTANYCGIGAALQQDTKTMVVTISRVYEGSPAEEAGLKQGDEIVMVNDIDGTSMELSDLVTHIRGEEDTMVHIVVNREGEELEFDVMRAKINIPTVDYRMLDGEIGLIQVSEFAESTPTQFKEAIDTLTQQGMKRMIVDLRSNGGGLVTACQQMLDMILPEGTVVYTEDKYGHRQDYTSDAQHSMDIPIVVLTNEYTASASEIFAGAIRDFDYGTLVGTTTFGKGIVQSIQPLSDGSAIKITTAKYYTPCGDNIHGVGIEPDVEVDYEYQGDAQEEYDPMKDSQVQKAIEVLNGAEE